MTPLSIARLPLDALQVASGAKSFEKNAVLRSKRLNRWGLHTRRVALALKMADARRQALAPFVSAQEAAAFQRDGFIRVENFLPADLFAEVTRELDEGRFQRYDMVQGTTVTRRVMIDAGYVDGFPGLAAARSSKRLAQIIRYVASHAGQPLLTLQVVQAKASSGAANMRDPQTLLHSDTFHPTAKAWLFLRDVGPDDGPFMYVPGSHRMTPERAAWEADLACNVDKIENKYTARGSFRIEAEKLDALGYPAPVPMVVPANTLIVADTHGFHARSSSPRETTRVEIYGSLRRNPFMPFTLPGLGGLHVGALPFVADRTNRAAITGLATLSRLGMGSNPWQDQGVGPALEWSKLLG